MSPFTLNMGNKYFQKDKVEDFIILKIKVCQANGPFTSSTMFSKEKIDFLESLSPNMCDHTFMQMQKKKILKNKRRNKKIKVKGERKKQNKIYSLYTTLLPWQ